MKGKEWRNVCDWTKLRSWEEIDKLFHNMLASYVQPPVYCYNSSIGVATRIGKPSYAFQMFDEIRQRGVPINIYTSASAIKSCIAMHRVDTVFPVMGHFIKIGHQPNIVTLTTLVDALFKARKGSDAFTLFVRIVQLRLCEPDHVLILTVIDGLCKDGQVYWAYDLLRSSEITHWEPDVKSYSALINGLCKAKNVGGALDLQSDMIRKGVSPDVVTYTTLIQGLCDAKLMDDACILLKKMKSSGLVNTTTFNILINAYSKDGNTEMLSYISRLVAKKSRK